MKLDILLFLFACWFCSMVATIVPDPKTTTITSFNDFCPVALTFPFIECFERVVRKPCLGIELRLFCGTHQNALVLPNIETTKSVVLQVIAACKKK